jgi:hypothetical protein
MKDVKFPSEDFENQDLEIPDFWREYSDNEEIKEGLREIKRKRSSPGFQSGRRIVKRNPYKKSVRRIEGGNFKNQIERS